MLHHLKGLLTTLYDVRIDDLRGAVTSWFSYLGDDLYQAGDQVAIELAARSSIDEDRLPEVDATITVAERQTGQPVLTTQVRVPRQPRRYELGILPEGTHLIEVLGRADTASISDVIVVATRDQAVET